MWTSYAKMVESSDLLGRCAPTQKVLSDFAGAVWTPVAFVTSPVNMLVKLIVDNSKYLSPMLSVLDILLAIAAVLYVFLTEVTNVPKAGAFAVTELTARSILFLSGLSLALLSVSSVLGYLLSSDKSGIVEKVTFSEKYATYLATFKHGIHSMLIVAVTMMMHLDSSDYRLTRWTWNTGGDDSGTITFLIVLFISLIVSKFLSEIKHGEDARLGQVEDEIIGGSSSLSADYSFKHARGAALTVSTGLLMYMLANGDLGKGPWEFLKSNMVALSLLVYMLVVALERMAGASEWVLGGSSGFVITGAVSFWNLISAALALAEDQTQSAVVVVLGSILLDTMRVGYGQPQPEKADVGVAGKVILRLLQAVAGVVAFVFVTSSETDQHAATSPLLFGVALASALVKIIGISYIGKDLLKASTEHHFRELASTGLLLSSAYLWSHPLDDSLSSTAATVFFALGVACRFLDSVLDFLMSGKDALKYITWDKEGEGVESPTSDNPRTWLTLLSLAASLVFAGMVMHEKIDDIQVHGGNVTVDGVETKRPLDKELSDSMIVAVTFISVHVAVVIIGLISEIPGAEPAALGALSRSKFVRFAVTTTVLSSLAVAAGVIGFEGGDVISTDAIQTDIISALVAYLFADVVGRELL